MLIYSFSELWRNYNSVLFIRGEVLMPVNSSMDPMMLYVNGHIAYFYGINSMLNKNAMTSFMDPNSYNPI